MNSNQISLLKHTRASLLGLNFRRCQLKTACPISQLQLCHQYHKLQSCVILASCLTYNSTWNSTSVKLLWTGLILATGIASESEVRWIEECTSTFHLNPSSCRISCFLYVRAFFASINLRCASEFGIHWRNRIVVVAIDGLPMIWWQWTASTFCGWLLCSIQYRHQQSIFQAVGLSQNCKHQLGHVESGIHTKRSSAVALPAMREMQITLWDNHYSRRR